MDNQWVSEVTRRCFRWMIISRPNFDVPVIICLSARLHVATDWKSIVSYRFCKSFIIISRNVSVGENELSNLGCLGECLALGYYVDGKVKKSAHH